MRIGFVRKLISGGVLCTAAWAQNPPTVTLMQAQNIALRNHPRISAAALLADASGFAVRQARAAGYPALSVNFSGIGAKPDSTLAAGAVTTSSIYSRVSSDLVATQLLTDFGRSANLVESARLRNASEDQNVANVRAQVLLEVREAYYQTLASESVLKVAQATLNLRSLTLRQVRALTRSNLRSTVDVSFAAVNVSQAELDLSHAESDAEASHARLSAALGYGNDQPFVLADEPLPPPLDPDINALIDQAMRERPDLAALRLNRDSLERYAEAEKRLSYPTITAAAATGASPVRVAGIQETYGGAGVIVNIPVLNGGLFKARHEEAESRAQSATKDVLDLSVEIARDVRVAWLDASDAFRRLGVTAQMVAEANEALRLAQARYDNALGSIVELNQAQLNQAGAEIASASAKYDYLGRRAVLNYAMGISQ
jgi:outer membrane protein